MNTKILTALTALAVITPLSALANSYDEKKNSSSSNFFNNDIFNDTYVSIGYGKSLPQGKLSGLTVDDYYDNPEYYSKTKLKNSNVFKASVGKKINDMKIEFEFLHSNKHKFNFGTKNEELGTNYLHKLHTSHYTYFINGLYEISSLHHVIKPYVGLGIGISHNKISAEAVTIPSGLKHYVSSKKYSNSFAWNASLGITVDISEHLFLDFSYKYIDLGKAKGSPFTIDSVVASDNNNIKGRFRNNVFLVSAGFKF
ncbi:hypothetical protein NF27_EY00830 [Candidatus Jidaibacter acanthamoeba]|uniref:Outer membrane protein beta-barrel domain-containing protein n=1 Tax=Candidatus Jidaibacter acanthamoebae TaxID=86105 RepID=A0A0C1MSH9_9RICK|nr:outer membrane beta-barrel protein [Candidatus Jidaibacter acanthamoeba]KIE04987.1 hypothetical protein NF27_EY00830 [Candidatus Jidaibacter acanthamoeba]